MAIIILLNNVQGIKKTTGALRKLMSGWTTYQNINICRGELNKF